ncbi:MarR family winged helix-turn-helix transcriptional regulator [Aliiroseovarius sp. 2305UL8-7]|uniref:MarR family winged helix-turn-helix transcriptional regulator n=1 Tax=Aliiroseovarius conchicola TaxID=3121637 RepID=UPI0035284CBA
MQRSLLLSGENWPSGTKMQSFGYLMQVLARRIDDSMKVRLEALDLDFRFFMTLMLLLARDGQSQRELGGKLNLPEYQVSRNLDAMTKAGLVERRPSPTSRRTTLIYLTDQGRSVAQCLPPVINDQNDRFLKSLKDDERAVLISLLQRVMADSAP